MSYIDSIAGNEEVKSSLAAALQNGTLSHAVLLTAPDGCGRNFAARCVAADFLFAESSAGGDAVMRGESPEVLLVEGEGKSGQIRVESIRQARSAVFHSALSAAGRVILIRDAHNMNIPAANALLKVLEEPPPGAILILTARDAVSLPATIQSRCTVYPLAPVSQQVCEETLKQHLPSGADPKLPALLALLYGGRIGSGLKVLARPERLDILQGAIKAAQAVLQPDRYTALRIFSLYEGRAEEDRAKRDALLSDTADILACVLRGITHGLLPSAPPEKAAAVLPLVTDTQLALRGNANPKLAFTAFVAKLRILATTTKN